MTETDRQRADAIEAAAKWIAKNILRTSWDGLGVEGRITDKGFDPFIWSPYGGLKWQGYQEDLRDLARQLEPIFDADDSELRARDAEIAGAYKHACHLANALREKHFPQNIGFTLLPDLFGVIDQIDNMSTIAYDYKRELDAERAEVIAIERDFRKMRDEKDAEIATLRAALEKAEVTIEPKPPAQSLPWVPHEGPPTMTPAEGLRLYYEKRSDTLARNVMTDEQRANFVGDAKPT